MLQERDIQLNHELELTLEVERVLDDPIFRRAPIQNRLLKFLLDRTVKGGTPPTQYEVAVDGLGKDEDYDLEGDSYPRVQVSRLRRNLDNYYSRNLPGHGMRVVLEQGAYRLELAPFTSPPSSKAKARKIWSVLSGQYAKIGIWSVLAMLGLAIVYYFAGQSPIADAGLLSARTGKPTTALMIDTGYAPDERVRGSRVLNSAERIAEIQLSNSFVSRPLAISADPANADYLVNLNFGSDDDEINAVHVSLADSDGDILYSREIALDPANLSDFNSALEASLVYMTSPIGTIAEAELRRVEDPFQSDYSCFLEIENQRSRSVIIEDLVGRCIEAFPESDYRAFWYARRAFASYQADILAGREVTRSGEAWADVSRAFEADRYNAFANFVAAKVELAEGNCASARHFVSQALERGGSYPALVAAMEANAASCAGTEEENAAMADHIRTLARFNPSPDPLLHLYLLIGLLGSGDREVAKAVAERTIIDQPKGAVESTSDLLRRALEDPRVARTNRDEIADAVYLFVWSDAATEQIVGTLTEQPAT